MKHLQYCCLFLIPSEMGSYCTCNCYICIYLNKSSFLEIKNQTFLQLLVPKENKTLEDVVFSDGKKIKNGLEDIITPLEDIITPKCNACTLL